MTRLTVELQGPDIAWSTELCVAVMPTSSTEREHFSGRLRQLPPLKIAERTEFLSDYRSLLARMDSANCHDERYWYSAMGTRNVQLSNLYTGLEQLWRLHHWLRGPLKDKRLRLVLPNQALLRPVSELLQLHDVTVEFCGGYAGHRRLDRLRRPWGAMRYLALICAPLKRDKRKPQANADVVFATVSASHFLTPESSVRDFIFGELPAQLENLGHTVMMLAQTTGNVRAAAKRAQTLLHPTILTLVDLASPIDVVAALSRALLWRPDVEALHSELGVSVVSLARIDATTSRWRDLPTALVLRRVLERVLVRSPGAIVIHPFENNGWEHVCRSVTHDQSMQTVAFQHNALTPGVEKMYKNPARPAPDVIVTSGPAASMTLRKQFGYTNTNIHDGYAIRQAGLYEFASRVKAPGTITSLLVLLQGTSEAIDLIDILYDTFRSQRELTLTLRPHPATELDWLLGMSTMREICPPFQISTELSLHKDLLRHQAALSCGSTAGWEAVALGIPTIHLDLRVARFGESDVCQSCVGPRRYQRTRIARGARSDL